MKKIITLLISILLLINLFNCTEKDSIPQDVEVQNFVWKAMNLYYLWQEDVPDLQDDRFTTQGELNSFLDGKTSENLFDELLFIDDGYFSTFFNKNIHFSWIVDDYIALENLFAGVTLNNGMEFGLKAIADDVQQVFGYVRYVIPNSDAAQKNIERGQIIYGINGQQLTRTNFRDLLFNNDTYTVDFGTYTFNGIAEITPNGAHTTLVKEELTENPVNTITINEIDGHKIGYLFYNQFVGQYDDDLNNAFQQFKNENITDLVLDLRYNGGGLVTTAISLASMITGQFPNQLYTTLNRNEKLNGVLGVQTANFVENLSNGNAINHLNLNQVYVLVSGSTASASELIINGLKPYIDVKLIGTQTVGKAVGSVTLYDSDDYGREGANPNHTYAIQPIITELTNKLGENNHVGFIPDINLPEDFANLGVIGNVNEPLFATAISEITANRKSIPIVKKLPSIASSKMHNAQNNMFIDLK